MKLIVCGPPHSGKSVFLGGLCHNLPRDKYFLFRACPDGEGTWLQRHYDDQSVAALRRKGEFSPELVNWYCQSLAHCEMAPIILVDIGGRCSVENARIIREGGITHAVILASKEEAIPEWERFLANLGIKIIAIIKSEYLDTEDKVEGMREGVLYASCHHLDRQDVVSNRPAIMAVAAMILDSDSLPAGAEKSAEAKGEDSIMLSFVSGPTMSIAALAAALEKRAEPRTLPNGKVVSQLVWEGSDLKKIAKILHNESANLPEVVDIDGAAPAWLVSALVHEVHPCSARLNSPDGFVAVGCKRPSGLGSGCGWNLTDIGSIGNGRRLVKVEFALDPSTPLAPTALDDIAPPAVGMGDVVVISGRGPNWLVASIAMSYHGRAASVAPWQPGTGATVSWTHVSDVGLGDIIPV